MAARDAEKDIAIAKQVGDAINAAEARGVSRGDMAKLMHKELDAVEAARLAEVAPDELEAFAARVCAGLAALKGDDHG